jgi:hypothetical protein
MTKWIVVTEVESEVDPAEFSYVNGTTLISSQIKPERTINDIKRELEEGKEE